MCATDPSANCYVLVQSERLEHLDPGTQFARTRREEAVKTPEKAVEKTPESPELLIQRKQPFHTVTNTFPSLFPFSGFFAHPSFTRSGFEAFQRCQDCSHEGPEPWPIM